MSGVRAGLPVRHAACGVRSGGEVEPHRPVALGVVAPVRAHLDEKEEVDVVLVQRSVSTVDWYGSSSCRRSNSFSRVISAASARNGASDTWSAG